LFATALCINNQSYFGFRGNVFGLEEWWFLLLRLLIFLISHPLNHSRNHSIYNCIYLCTLYICIYTHLTISFNYMIWTHPSDSIFDGLLSERYCYYVAKYTIKLSLRGFPQYE
jgi:hypothetical protein